MINSSMARVSLDCLSLVQGTAHTLIAGATGSGKSALLNSILYSVIKKGSVLGEWPSFVMIDTKRVELKQYKNYAFTVKYITEPEDVPAGLDWVIKVMDNRYDEMVGKTSDKDALYVVVDELADLLGTKGVLERLVKIGRLGRAANIHLLMCTQDPSRTTLSAQIMQNMTTRVALRCDDVIDSRQIIKMDGAEKLPKHGKAIVKDANGVRTIDVPLTPDEDIDTLMSSLGELCDYYTNKRTDFPQWISRDLIDRIEGRPWREICTFF